jgi:hypothetical protein
MPRVRLIALSLPALAAAAASLVSLHSVGAHEACNNRTVQGEFALSAQGQTENLQHTTENLGRIIVDGNGHLTGTLTISVSGRVARNQTLTGSYAVLPDCTGSETFTIGSDPAQRNADFVAADDGHQIFFLETDTGTVFSGTATRQ